MDTSAIQDDTAAMGIEMTRLYDDEDLNGLNPDKSKLCFARFKHPENKSREQLKALVHRYQAMYDERLRMFAELKSFSYLYARLDSAIKCRHHNICCILDRAKISETDALNELSAAHLGTLNRVLEYDEQKGAMMWELYQLQKKMCAHYDSLEETMAFREEHFVMDKREEDGSRIAGDRLAYCRSWIRNLGPKLLKDLQTIKDSGGWTF